MSTLQKCRAEIIKKDHGKLAILGGKPLRDKGAIGPRWPHVDENEEKDSMIDGIIMKVYENRDQLKKL